MAFFTECMFADVLCSVSTHVDICFGTATQKIPSQLLSLTYVNMRRITIVGVKRYKYNGSISHLVAQLATVEVVDILHCMLVSGCVV